MKKYKVYFVGAGPAEEDLITVRGANVLSFADTIIYDYLSSGNLLKRANSDAELICAGRLAKKGLYSGNSYPKQKKINKLIVKKAREGRRVVRLKNGSLALFSRISEELDSLTKEGIEFELVPGVTAAEAAASALGIPLTERTLSSSCAFITGHQVKNQDKNIIDWEGISKASTIVLYMGVKNLKRVTEKLIKYGYVLDTPAIAVENVSAVNQKAITGSLANICRKAEENKLKPPAVIIIGRVCAFYKKFNQDKKEKKVLFTGLSKKRFFLNGSFSHLPLIEIKPAGNYSVFDNHLRKIERFDWVVFTSRYGVKYFFQRLKKVRLDSRALAGIKIAAIGNSTKNKLQDFGIIADLVPEVESSAGLIKAFERLDIKDKNIFLPRSDISDKALTKQLRQMQAQVEEAVAYRNVAAGELPSINWDNFSRVFFTSPSGVRSFRKRYRKVPKKIKVDCIGEVTKKEAKKWDFLK